MNVARYIFGIIYLLGAGFNIFIFVTEGWQPYIGFADETFFPLYREVWMAIAAPNITLIIGLLIVFEISLGLLFFIKRTYLILALILGILFCLASMPTMIEAIYTNLPLALIQAFLLLKELRRNAAMKNTQGSL